jgi:hypothetical protein
MANRVDYYFEQLVTEGELDKGFNYLELAEQAIVADHDLSGIWNGLTVTQNSGTPNLTVDVALGTAYDADGQRIRVPSQQDIDCSVDYLAVSTAVATPGNEKYLAIFAEFDRALSDPRTDGHSSTVYFERAESFTIWVKQGTEAAIGAAVKPALESGAILLCDVRLINAQTQILNADITTDRTQVPFRLTGTLSVTEKTAKAAMQDVMDHVNGIVAGTTSILASGVDYAGGASWHDGTTNPAASVEAQLDKMLTELAGETTGTGNGGAALIGANSIAGSPDSFANDSIFAMFQEALSFINGRGRLTGTNTWTALNTFNGASTFAAALATSKTLSGGHGLIWQIDEGGSEYTRLYQNGSFLVLTRNASFNGTIWTKDTNALLAMKWEWESNGQFHYEEDSVNHATITWLNKKYLDKYNTQNILTPAQGSSAGASFFTSADLNEKRVQDGTDIKISLTNLLTSDIVKVRSTFQVRYSASTPAPMVSLSVYYDSTEHKVDATHLQVTVDGTFVHLYGEYIMPSDEATAEVAILMQNQAAGTSDFRGEYGLWAEVNRP